MKKATILNFGLILMFTIGMAKYNNIEASQPYGVNFQIFYNELSPYGDWVMDPTYGYVWIPNVDRNFHPYSTNGYWTMTNYGNTWVSDYSWGWAPFHYGRWMMDDFYGWAWVPDYEWGPAWVNWRTGGGYYGWSPLAPGVGINISVNFHRNHWIFVPQRRFRHRNFHSYHVPSYQVVNIYNRTTIINNTYVYNNTTYVTGPSRREIERVTRQSVPVYEVRNSERAGRTSVNNNTVAMYRPEVNNSRSVNAQAKPSRAFTAEEYKSRNAGASRNNQVVTPTGNSRSQANAANANGATTPERTRSTTANDQQSALTNRNTGTASGNTGTTRASNSSASTPQRRANEGTAAATSITTRESAVKGSNLTQERRTAPAVRTQQPPLRENRMAPTQQTPRNTGTVQGGTRTNQRVSTPAPNQNRNNGTVTRGNSSSRNSTQASQPTRSNTRVSAPANSTRGGAATTGSRTSSSNRTRGEN